MKRRLFDLLGASIASIGLLTQISNALVNNLDFSTNFKEIQALEGERKSSGAIAKAKTQYQKLLSPDQPIENLHYLPLAANSLTTQPNQPNLRELSVRGTKVLGGLFITSLFIGYILVGLHYKKHRTSHAAILLQKIETLEKNWNISSNKELEAISLKEKVEILERIWRMPPQQRQNPFKE